MSSEDIRNFSKFSLERLAFNLENEMYQYYSIISSDKLNKTLVSHIHMF